MEEKPGPRRAFLRRLRNFFFTTVIGGLVVVMPISLLLMIIRFIFNFTTNFLDPIIKLFDFENKVGEWLIDLIALSAIIMLFFIIGLTVRTELGSKLFNRIDKQLLSQLPFYSILRDTVQQFFGNKKVPFSQVVLVDVFNNDTLMTGFVTGELENGLYTIFVPTGPNPTNGFIFHVKKHQLTFLKVRPEEAMRTIIGVGTGSEILFREDMVGKRDKKEHLPSDKENIFSKKRFIKTTK